MMLHVYLIFHAVCVYTYVLVLHNKFTVVGPIVVLRRSLYRMIQIPAQPEMTVFFFFSSHEIWRSIIITVSKYYIYAEKIHPANCRFIVLMGIPKFYLLRFGN